MAAASKERTVAFRYNKEGAGTLECHRLSLTRVSRLVPHAYYTRLACTIAAGHCEDGIRIYIEYSTRTPRVKTRAKTAIVLPINYIAYAPQREQRCRGRNAGDQLRGRGFVELCDAGEKNMASWAWERERERGLFRVLSCAGGLEDFLRGVVRCIYRVRDISWEIIVREGSRV